MTVAPRSRRHSKVAPASLVNDHEGVRLVPGVAGAEVIVGIAGGRSAEARAIVLVVHLTLGDRVEVVVPVGAAVAWSWSVRMPPM